ncbi:hypothetical protein O181_028052 [Austropuccinia psidii MF-1]|uniref:Uncharacterized protein n=1 Tax=Austropuccinia psidii MF-1 TaxID=1389203 RepID=A0A9Q3H287_9BASI|nr:hypothetical protein [Austropuccinia psidii MF-1]
MRRLPPHRLIISPLYHAYFHARTGPRILASSSQTISMLTHPHCPPDLTPTLPPHLRSHHSLHFHTPTAPSRYAFNAALTPPYAFSHPPNSIHPLPSLGLHSALPTFLQLCPHTSLILNAAYHT